MSVFGVQLIESAETQADLNVSKLGLVHVIYAGEKNVLQSDWLNV